MKQNEIVDSIINNGEYRVYKHRLYKFSNDQWMAKSELDFRLDIAYEIQSSFPEYFRQSFVNDCCLLAMAKLRKDYIVKSDNEWLLSEPPSGVIHLSCKNTILAFNDRTGDLSPTVAPKELFFSTSMIPHNYDPSIEIPRELFSFFKECELDHYQIEDILYSLADSVIQDLNLSTLLYVTGDGEEGKSVINAFAEAIVGSYNTVHLSMEQLSGENRFALYNAIDKKLLVVDETSPTKVYKTAQLKKIVSRGAIYLESKGVQGQKETLKTKIIITSNYLPNTTDTSHGFIRRLVLVRMNKKIPKEKQKPELLNPDYWNSSGEAEKIFNFLIPYIQNLIVLKRFPESHHSLGLKLDYEKELSPIRSFLTDFYTSTGNKQDILSTNEIFDHYCLVCNQERQQAGSLRDFTRELKKVFPNVTQSKNPVSYHSRKKRVLYGIALKKDFEFESAEQWNSSSSRNEGDPSNSSSVSEVHNA